MHYSIEARNLISQGKFREASALIDREFSKGGEKDDLWYLRGIISLKLNNYDNAQECFERALAIKNNSQYHKIIGMAHLEMFEIEQAVEAFSNALNRNSKDPEANFFMAICLVLLDDPRSKQYIEKAYLLDRKKTKELLKSFYSVFFLKDNRIKEAVKREFEKKLDSIN